MEGNKIISLDFVNIQDPPIKLQKINGEMHYGIQVKFVDWEINGGFKALHDEPKVGFSVIIDPQKIQYTWLTTIIVKIESDIIVDGHRCILFKTENSRYKLYINKSYE